VDERELWFCLGLIAGEGSFSHAGNAPVLTVCVKHDDPEMLRTLQRCFGGRVYGIESNAYQIQWTLRGQELINALPLLDLMPSCRKREQYLAWRQKYKMYLKHGPDRRHGFGVINDRVRVAKALEEMDKS
jgi:hypothetical protein